MEYFIGVDFGGSSNKIVLIDNTGRSVASETCEYPSYYPQSGWVEQKPEDWWNAFVVNIRALLKETMVKPDDIAAIAFSAASMTGVYLDEHDQVIRDSIHWSDKRAIKEVQWLKEKYEAKILATCSNPPAPLRTLTHLMWLRENEPNNFKRIRKVMFEKDYIRYRLTGDFVTDYIDAMGSLMMDVRSNTWSEELCELAGISTINLPVILKPTDIVGPIRPEQAAETGLSTKTKVVVGTTDTVLEVYANGAIAPGDMTVKLATAGRICSITRGSVSHPEIVNYKHVVPGLWYPGTGMMSCAASYRWYRDVLCKGESMEAEAAGTDVYALLDREAERVPEGNDNFFFHPYLQGERSDPSLCASFVGMCSYHTKAHFSRAILEGVGYGMKMNYNVIRSLGVDVNTPVIIGGGAKSPLWRQIMADMLNVTLAHTESSDSSMGAAMLAGVAVGGFSTFENSVKCCVKIVGYHKPIPEHVQIYEKGFQRFAAIMEALKPVYHQL